MSDSRKAAERPTLVAQFNLVTSFSPSSPLLFSLKRTNRGHSFSSSAPSFFNCSLIYTLAFLECALANRGCHKPALLNVNLKTAGFCPLRLALTAVMTSSGTVLTILSIKYDPISILIQVAMQLLRAFRVVFRTKPLRTESIHKFTNKQLATPEVVRTELLKRLPWHSRLSQISMYHGKRTRHAIRTCFSQKKSKKFKRVNKIKLYVHSEILDRKLYIRMSKKAQRTMNKYGSFDKYILLSSPKKLDSKMGEYYRALMMRKINDPTYRVPYVIGSGRIERIRRFKRYSFMQQQKKMVVPKDFKKKLMTYQRKFGTSVEQFAEEDYQKYLEVEKLKKLWGKDIDTRHPLLLEIQDKLSVRLTPEEVAAMEERADQFKQEYLNHPKNRQLRQQSYEYNERQMEKESAKAREAWLKHQLFGEAERDE